MTNKENCPFCEQTIELNFVDIGGGEMSEPAACEACGAFEIGAYDEIDKATHVKRGARTIAGWVRYDETFDAERILCNAAAVAFGVVSDD